MRNLLTPGLAGWRLAGVGGVRPVADMPGAVESRGGPGLLWYAAERFGNFVLDVAWRLTGPNDNSGIFLRVPALGNDLRPAIREGYEAQIDDRGLDPETGCEGSPLHRSGAIYRLAPAARLLSAPIGQWNKFHIVARGRMIEVALNGQEAARLAHAGRRLDGHVALQCHHPGSAVQFCGLWIEPLCDGDGN